MKPLILIDGSSYLYRAFHALPSLTNTRGQPTGAIYGVVNMIRKLLSLHQPDHIAVVFDAKGKTFRDDLYPAYKANRPSMPEALASQIEPLHRVIRHMGIPLIAVAGVEADDVIGTLATQAAAQGRDVLISTGDKDIAQLVSPHITLVNTMSDTVLDKAGVLAKFGVSPEQMTDYLALIGDAVDNVPGVPNVGPKTAVKWLEQYGSLDEIIAHAADIKGKVGENLRSSLETLPLSRALVTLKLDVALPDTLEYLTMGAPDKPALREFFKEMEFKTWLKALLEEADDQTPDTHYETVLTEEAFETWMQKLTMADAFAFDVTSASFSLTAGEVVCVPVDMLARLKPMFLDKTKVMIGHNLKRTLSTLASDDIDVENRLHDIMLISYILDPSSGRHDLETLALKHLGRRTTAAAPENADLTLQLHEILWQEVEKNPALKRVLEDVEFPLARVLSRIERNGVKIDPKKLAEQSHDLGQRIHVLQEKAYQLAGTMFNLSSPKQLQHILYQALKLPVLSKTPAGVPSTAEAVLQELAVDYPLPAVILEYRSLSKLKSTYTDTLPQQISPVTGRVHTTYNQAVTATGRLSSTDPNLQNIPIRTEEGRRVRKAFVAPPGYKLISADYSQVELRIMAHLSQDPGLLRAFDDDQDIHAVTAAEVFGVPLADVTTDQRRHAKAINFGLIYGMSAFGLAKQLQVDRQVAQSYIDRYFQRYPGVHRYMEDIRALAKKQGYVETLLGRRLQITEINSPNAIRRKAAERAAINAPMQGTAADIIKIAMIALDQWLLSSGTGALMIMQVHDELVLEVPVAHVEAVSAQVVKLMTGAMSLDVPLKVHVGVGDNWDEAH